MFIGLFDQMNDAEKSNDKGRSKQFFLFMKKLHDWDPNYVKITDYVSPTTMAGLTTLYDALGKYNNEDLSFSQAIAYTVYNAMVEYASFYVGGTFGAIAGQYIIPVPLVGSIIGNIAGRITTRVAATYLVNLVV